MAIFKTLITKTPKTPKTPDPSRAFLTLCSSFSSTQSSSLPLFTTTTIFSSSSSSILRLTSSARFLSPFIRFTPFSGPLFLSSPPWQLLQFATPLYLQGEFILRKAETLTPKLPFPIKLKFAPVGKVGLGNLVEKKEALPGRDGEEGFFNVPNLISISRMVSGPFLGWMIINEWYLPAFVGLAVSGATDWLDGYMARRMGINSVVGSYLDPLADKVLIGSVALAMVKMDLLQPWLVGLVVLRDVGLVSGAFYKRASTLDWQWKSWSEFTNLDGTHPQKVEPLFLSKVNTVFQLVLVAAALLQPEFGTEETRIYVDYLSWLVASTTMASTAAYGAQHLRNGSRAIAKQSFSGRKS